MLFYVIVLDDFTRTDFTNAVGLWEATFSGLKSFCENPRHRRYKKADRFYFRKTGLHVPFRRSSASEDDLDCQLSDAGIVSRADGSELR